LLEAIAQFTRALDQIAILPSTPALRREEIKLQVALITPLIHVKGYAPETRAAAERARLLIEQAEALGDIAPGHRSGVTCVQVGSPWSLPIPVLSTCRG
jgi:hypothetical protein